MRVNFTINYAKPEVTAFPIIQKRRPGAKVYSDLLKNTQLMKCKARAKMEKRCLSTNLYGFYSLYEALDKSWRF